MRLAGIKKWIPLRWKAWLKSRIIRLFRALGLETSLIFEKPLPAEREAILRHMEGIIAGRPLDVSLETITVCNARCVFCAYRRTKRETEVMTMELYKKILDEYAGLGGGPLGLAPLMADPLLDPLLFDRIRMANSYNKFRLHVFTNGIRFAKFTDGELREFIVAMDTLDVSLGGLDPEDYEKMFGVDKFDEVWQSLERIARLVKEGGLRARIQLHFRTFDKARVEGHARYAQLRSMGFNHIFIMTQFNNWGGVVAQKDLPEGARILPAYNYPPLSPCLIPATEMTILPNGDVVACGCYDGAIKHIMGNVAGETVSAVWRGEAYASFRSHFNGRDLHALCKNCGFYEPYGQLLSQPGLAGFDPSGEIFWRKISR